MTGLRHELLPLLGRERQLFAADLERHGDDLSALIRGGSFLVLGGAGSIGQVVVKEMFRHRPGRLHVVDTSESNLVELVRDIRSSYGYIEGEFRTLCLDCGDLEFEAFMERTEPYDVVLNLAAMKHVRSEADPFTLMRMVRANILNTESTLQHSVAKGVERYFAVSSDKAANPASAMGATKRVMELCLVRASSRLKVSSARFANVAFSDGSLLHGFTQRLAKRQPLAAPEDVRRYFITPAEAAVLCLMACFLGRNREVFVPSPSEELRAMDFRGIAERYLRSQGYRPHPCATEDEARGRVEELAAQGSWPCYFFTSDTTGEKPLEEFSMAGEEVDRERYCEMDVIRWSPLADESALDSCLQSLRGLRAAGRWDRADILGTLKLLLPEFSHQEKGQFLGSRM